MDENWDYLIVLDACRYDYFKKCNDIKGKLKKKISLGTHTDEWDEKLSTTPPRRGYKCYIKKFRRI